MGQRVLECQASRPCDRLPVISLDIQIPEGTSGAIMWLENDYV